MSNFLLKLKKILFAEREIICISNGGIKSKRIGFVFLIWNILLVFWTAFTTVKYFDLRDKIVLRENQITELNIKKQKLLSNIAILEKNISNIKDFIISLNKYDRFITIDETGLNNVSINSDNFDTNYNLVLDRAKDNMKKINLALVDRINGLEKVREQLNINNNIQQVAFQKEANDDDIDIYDDVADSIILKKTLDNNISYLENLEDFINAMPFSEPMESNYVSSKFGKRLDPFIKKARTHHGVDLVGSYMAKIYATSDGKVIFAGKKGGYGNVVILQHKYNMKTVYAHLNSFNVKLGDTVKRGEIIGIQGSTGRSTGQHLHYEIIGNNQRYNPLDFVEIGTNFY